MLNAVIDITGFIFARLVWRGWYGEVGMAWLVGRGGHG